MCRGRLLIDFFEVDWGVIKRIKYLYVFSSSGNSKGRWILWISGKR